MQGAGRRFRLGVIGDPVAHSISPAMQQPALDALGIDAVYERWHTPLAELPARIAGLRADDVLGANVTVPHKRAVMDLIDEISPLARKAGAVNTIVNREGRLVGDNTDVHGFAASLRESFAEAGARPALILGAGGAARAVALALAECGSAAIAIVNRDRAKAEALAADLGLAKLRVASWSDAELDEEIATASVLVNATSLGWHAGEMPIEAARLNHLPRSAVVVDLTYRDTDLLEAARERGLGTLDGLGMLVHQGALAFERFTGQVAPVEIMRAAAAAARAPRS
jgi:shikimate dehydrogenase